MSTQLLAAAMTAMRSAGVVWVAVGDAAPVAVSPLWWQASVVVLHGPGEHMVPGLATASEALLIVPAHSTGARLLEVSCRVEHLTPSDHGWPEVVALLLATRLNLPDPATAPARWAAHGCVSRLRPQAPAAP